MTVRIVSTLRTNPKLIAFGVLSAFFSGPGQTFLFSIFVPHIEKAFHTDHAGLAALFGLATLCGAFSLPFLGRMLDRSELTRFTLWMAGCLSLGCWLLGSAQNLAMVFIGMLMIRSFGQGAMGLISSTTMARNFHIQRGTALSLASMGHCLSTAILPVLVTAFVAFFGWRAGWKFLSLMILIVFIPNIFWLLRDVRGQYQAERKKRPQKTQSRFFRSWIFYRRLFQDPIFYLAAFAGLCVPICATGLFYHQVSFAQWKGWSAQLMATAFIAFSVTRALTALTFGGAIDRFGAKRLYGFFPIPLMLGILCLYGGKHALWSFAYMALAGISLGAGMTIRPAFWAEFRGTRELGALSGVTSFLAIVGTALSPAATGWLMAQTANHRLVLTVFLGFAAMSTLCGLAVAPLLSRRHVLRRQRRLHRQRAFRAMVRQSNRIEENAREVAWHVRSH